LQQKSAPGWSQCSSHNPHTYADTHSCELIHYTHTLAHLRRKSAEIWQRRGQIELFMHTVSIQYQYASTVGYLIFTFNAYAWNDIDHCLYSVLFYWEWI